MTQESILYEIWFLSKIYGFKAWGCDFWTPQVVEILADVLILKNDAFWTISREFLQKYVKTYCKTVVKQC